MRNLLENKDSDSIELEKYSRVRLNSEHFSTYLCLWVPIQTFSQIFWPISIHHYIFCCVCMLSVSVDIRNLLSMLKRGDHKVWK